MRGIYQLLVDSPLRGPAVQFWNHQGYSILYPDLVEELWDDYGTCLSAAIAGATILEPCHEIRAHSLSLAQSKLRLRSANHRPGYWSNLPCDWPSTAWAYSEQETENGPWSLQIIWRLGNCRWRIATRIVIITAGLILGLRPANERCRYKVTPSLIGWAQT